MVCAHISEPARIQNREDTVLPYGLVKRSDKVVLRNGADREELLHQFVFAFCHKFDQCFVRGFGIVFKHVRDSSHSAASIPIRRVEECLHRDQVDDSMKPMLVHDRQLHRDHLPAPTLAHDLKHLHPARSRVGFRMIDLIDHNHAGQVDLRGEVPRSVCHRFDAVLRIDEDDRGFGGQHRGASLVNEHVKAGGVEKIDLRAAPLGKRCSIRHGHAAADLFFVVRRHRCAVLKTRGCRRHLRCLQDGGDQSGLSAMCVPNHGDIPKIASSVALHPALLLRSWRGARIHGCGTSHRSSPAVEGRRPPVKAAILDRNGNAFHVALPAGRQRHAALAGVYPSDRRETREVIVSAPVLDRLLRETRLLCVHIVPAQPLRLSWERKRTPHPFQ